MKPSPGQQHAILVSGTHWDREWAETFEVSRQRLVEMMDRLLDLLARKPQFRSFNLDGQTVPLEDYLAVRPRRAEVRRWVKAGRLVIGPWYTMPDEFLSGGEALIRNLLLGQQIAGRFGKSMKVGYSPDPFGHIAQMPQILRGFGIDAFIFSRGLGDIGEEIGSEFRWVGPDGSQVIAIRQVEDESGNSGYCNAAWLGLETTSSDGFSATVARAEHLLSRLSQYARTPYLLLNNGCDQTPPQEDIPELLEQIRQVLPDIVVSQGTYEEFVRRVRPWGRRLARWSGEMREARYAPILAGVLSARMSLKQANVRTLALLERYSEPLASLATWLGAAYPHEELAEAWRLVLQNHAHDSICGCGVDQVADDVQQRFAQAQERAVGAMAGSAVALAEWIDWPEHEEAQVPVLVFNPSGYQRTDVVKASVALLQARGQWAAIDLAASSLIQAQRDDSGDVRFVARDVPAVGYRCYFLVRHGQGAEVEALPHPSLPAGGEGGGGVIANEFYQITAQHDGSLTIQDRRTGRTLRCCHIFEDVGDAGDEYTFSPPEDAGRLTSLGATVKVRRILGPAQSVLRMRFDWLLPKAAVGRKRRSRQLVACPIVSEVALYPGVDRIDFRTTVDNRARDHRLRVLFPTEIMTPAVYAETPFTILQRDIALPQGAEWRERPLPTAPQSGLVAVHGGQAGFALMAPGLPEYEALPTADGVTLALTLLRCVGWLSQDGLPERPGHAGPALLTPGAQCLGQHEFQYAIRLLDGRWNPGEVAQAAHNYRAPLVALPVTGGDGSLPLAHSFLELEGEGLLLSALKRAETGNGWIVRVVNFTPTALTGRVRLGLPCKAAWLTRLDENVIQALPLETSDVIPFSAPGYSIVTLRLALESR